MNPILQKLMEANNIASLDKPNDLEDAILEIAEMVAMQEEALVEIADMMGEE